MVNRRSGTVEYEDWGVDISLLGRIGQQYGSHTAVRMRAHAQVPHQFEERCRPPSAPVAASLGGSPKQLALCSVPHNPCSANASHQS